MYKVEVFVQGSWASNALVFDTIEQAQAYGTDLMARWMLVEDWRVVANQEDIGS
mgnify:CR=1 FL=1